MAVTKKIIKEVWDVKDPDWQIKEDFMNESHEKSLVDGKTILAVVEGVHFVPDGLSRNERFYTKEGWKIILARKELMEKLSNRTMFGCLGHDDRGVSEKDLEEGRISHIVTKLWIDEEGRGMGQSLILGTPAGKNLYCIMKAGSKIKVSSRASGDYKENEDWNGYPVIDEATYDLETFDFVFNPGFLETDPKLKESLNKLESEMKGKDEIMNEKFMQELEASRNTLQERLLASETTKAVCESKVAGLEKQVNEAVTSLSEATKKITEANEKIANLEKTISESVEQVKTLTTTNEELVKTTTEKSEAVKLYEEIGTVKEIMETLDIAEKTLESYREIGTPEEIQETFVETKAVLEAYAEFGNYGEVKSIIETAEQIVLKLKTEKLDDTTLRIATEYLHPVEDVREMVEKLGEKRTTEILKNLKASKKEAKVEKLTEKKAGDAPKKSSAMDRCEGNGASRYFDRFNRPVND